MKKRVFAFFLALSMLFAFAGCNRTSDSDVIQPIHKNIKTPTMGIPLYFGYKNQQYLCAELREIPQSYDVSIEQLAINELVKGPSNISELYPLIPTDTTVSVSGVSDTLFVTLSSDFMDTMSGENKNYTSNPEDLAEVLRRRKLAVYSIVNTVTEIGNYSRVQILISDRKTPEGNRPKMYDVGFASSDDNKFLDTLPRSPEVILTPQSAVSGVFAYIQEKQWDSVYKCMYQGEASASPSVSSYDFTAYAERTNIVIESFSVNNNVTYNDNGIAIVNVNFIIRNNSGSTEYTQIPVKLMLTDNIWKVEYASVIKILEKVN